MTPELLTVKKNERAEVRIVYQPMSDAPLPANLELRAKVTNGRTYHMPLLGRGKRPRLSFSFASHDFGPCFVVTPKNGMAPVSVDLRLANEDEHEVYLDTPHPSPSPGPHPHLTPTLTRWRRSTTRWPPPCRS